MRDLQEWEKLFAEVVEQSEEYIAARKRCVTSERNCFSCPLRREIELALSDSDARGSKVTRLRLCKVFDWLFFGTWIGTSEDLQDEKG